MRILTFNWHTPYLSMLARLDHEFEVAPPNNDAPNKKSWDETMRPLTANVSLITSEQMQMRLKENKYYDLMIAHNVKDIMMAVDYKLPKILLFHNKLSTEAKLGEKTYIIDQYRDFVKSVTTDVHCIFISESKRMDWGLQGEIILPGIDTSLYGGYTGAKRVALRIGNSIRARDLMTGYSIQEKTLAGLPNLLMGENPDIPGCKVSKDWDELKQAYRDNRLFLNTSMPPWEDGYNLAVLEAMATGAPVVSIANKTCPVTDGVDGFVSGNITGLRERIIKLLNDPVLAKEIGANGKKMVERLFPMSLFLDKWSKAIDKACRWYSPPSEAITGNSQTFPQAAMPAHVPGGKKILMAYSSFPATAAAYFDRAFRNKHTLLTTGGKLTPFIIKKWNLYALKEEAKTQDIPTPELTVDMEEVLKQVPQEFEPEIFLWIETGLGKAPENMGLLSCPRVAYLIDTHMHLDKHLEIGKQFDIVFLAQRKYMPLFNEQGISNIHWLPLGCDPQIHGKRKVEKIYDVGFVGSLITKRRVELLQKLAEKVDIEFDRLFMDEMTQLFCKSRIVFNNAIRDDLNMRVFEALCSGSLLMTDKADGLDVFFEDKDTLVLYNDENIVDVANYYLKNSDERERIAEKGRLEVLAHHTYAHRVDQMIDIINKYNG